MTEELKMQIILLLSNYLMTENTNILDEILTICNNEIRNNNEDAKIYFYRGLCRYNYKLYGEAIRDFNKSLILGFKNEKIYFYIGYCKFHFKQYKEAINDFDKYIKLSKEYKLQYLNMSIKEYKSKNNDDYTLNLLKAFLKNNFGDEYFFRGYCKLQLKDNYGAFEDFNVSIKLNYKNVDSYFYMGHCNI
ncbi:tetratricopeptide repeat protein, partial [Brachyspira hampsonii]|nr:hypothetical protein [Brachyspira hampsonii]